jgi:lipopolysaccharide/colanic/teichoic acid biosynthesis glycosyltransferase
MPTGAYIRSGKRCLDAACAAGGLLLLSPLLCAAALAVKLNSRGPVFFRQIRVGLDGKTFRIFKFRTMVQDAAHKGPLLTADGDPRITRSGKWLRKTKVDELPQLLNVLAGDMSLVGPRPERPELLVNLALAIPFFEERMRDIKPGITGLAQISLGYTGRAPEHSEVAAFEATLTNPFGFEEAEGAEADDMRMKLLFDLAYSAALESLSTYLRTELSVIFKTPLVMVLGLGR